MTDKSALAVRICNIDAEYEAKIRAAADIDDYLLVQRWRAARDRELAPLKSMYARHFHSPDTAAAVPA